MRQGDVAPADPNAGARRIVPALALAFACCGTLGLSGCGAETADRDVFRHSTMDTDGPRNPWAKAVGDIDGDGRPDFVVGGHGAEPPALVPRILNKLGLRDYTWPDRGKLVWYQSRSLKPHLVSDQYNIRTDIEVVDIDGDGRNDIVAVTDQGLVWFRNPDWTPTLVDARVLHDVEVADLDGDGKPDMVARNQQLFGFGDGDRLHFYRQASPAHWVHAEREVRPHERLKLAGEGLKVADIDGDNRPDVVVNQFWMRNPGQLTDLSAWETVPYCADWHWPHAYIDVADVNGDGRPDIVMAPAEPIGMKFRLSWCEAPATAGGEWTEHVIDPDVESAMHSVVAGDFDGDGKVEIVSAHMHIAEGRKDVAMYRRAAVGQPWSRSVIGRTGSHSMKALDFDQDGDLDLFGANLWGDHQPVELWTNHRAARTAPGWRRHVIADDKPWRSVFVHAADLDGDGLKDLVAGSRWYRNPGAIARPWQAFDVGAQAHNVALVHDFDGDGMPDLLASTWNDPRGWTLYERALRKLGLRSYGLPGGFVWARNAGAGRFEVLTNVPAGTGDFLQGVATLPAPDRRVVLSWHEAGPGLEQLHVPADPKTQPWQLTRLSAASQDEQLSAADIDGDGMVDLVLGTQWLRQAADGGWAAHDMRQPPGKPDRHRVADIDGDGLLDVVVGFEAVSTPGKLAWYHRGSDPTLPWKETVIAQVIGPMSLDLADMDGDGDLDVVVGEHNLRHPAAARLLWFENLAGDGSRWVAHAIHVGDEHHNGALVVDIDNDGDLDIVSIGWGHDRLIVYENLSITPTN